MNVASGSCEWATISRILEHRGLSLRVAFREEYTFPKPCPAVRRALKEAGALFQSWKWPENA